MLFTYIQFAVKLVRFPHHWRNQFLARNFQHLFNKEDFSYRIEYLILSLSFDISTFPKPMSGFRTHPPGIKKSSIHLHIERLNQLLLPTPTPTAHVRHAAKDADHT